MQIIIFDDNKIRATSLSNGLDGQAVSDKRHIDGTDEGNGLLSEEYNLWSSGLIQEVSVQVTDVDLILLHTSNSGAEQALQNVYQDKYVICFSGGGIAALPGSNPAKHCFIKESIGGDDGKWSKHWCNRIDEFIKVLEEKDGDFFLARDKISGFNHKLEENLDILYNTFKKSLNQGAADMKEVIELRNRLLPQYGSDLL